MVEVIDFTEDDRYYPMGVWPTPQEADAAINDHLIKNDGEPPSSGYTYSEEGVKLEIRQLSTGWGEPTRIKTREWSCVYKEQTDTWIWQEV